MPRRKTGLPRGRLESKFPIPIGFVGDGSKLVSEGLQGRFVLLRGGKIKGSRNFVEGGIDQVAGKFYIAMRKWYLGRGAQVRARYNEE